MVNLVDNMRFLYAVLSILLIQAVAIIANKNAMSPKASEKKETHWTTMTYFLTQVFMIVTVLLEAAIFDVPLTIWNNIGLILIFIVMIITYLSYSALGEYYSPKIEIKKRHKLVDKGIYGIIRHPMDLASLLFMIALPMAAGAYFSYIWIIPFCVVLFFKIRYEEHVLSRDLRGYKSYMKRTKRLIPYLL